MSKFFCDSYQIISQREIFCSCFCNICTTPSRQINHSVRLHSKCVASQIVKPNFAFVFFFFSLFPFNLIGFLSMSTISFYLLCLIMIPIKNFKRFFNGLKKLLSVLTVPTINIQSVWHTDSFVAFDIYVFVFHFSRLFYSFHNNISLFSSTMWFFYDNLKRWEFSQHVFVFVSVLVPIISKKCLCLYSLVGRSFHFFVWSVFVMFVMRGISNEMFAYYENLNFE